MTPIHSHYGGFSEGDHVTRDGTDVQLVKDRTDDGFAATFVCVVAPAIGWCDVGEEENNLCRRYERVTQNTETGAWELTPGERHWQYIDPLDLVHKLVESVGRAMISIAAASVAGGASSEGFARAWRNQIRRQQSRAYYRRQPKRRALRK